MHESSAFDLYEARGEAKGELRRSHHLLLRLGRKKFGDPDSATEDALRGVTELDRLDRLGDAILTANSWAELLSTP